MWLEQMVSQLEDVPLKTSTELGEMRKRDRLSRDMLNSLNAQESELIESMKKACKEITNDFDEAPYLEKAKELISKRAEITKLLDERNKHTQDFYDVLDKRIAAFDSKTESIQHLMVYDPNDTLSKRKKKKRKDEEGELIPIIDPNEPVYCTCKMMALGAMVGCDGGDECEVGWFHNKCVGLSEDPEKVPDKWYCSACIVRLGIEN
jgi:hypothetical protein